MFRSSQVATDNTFVGLRVSFVSIKAIQFELLIQSVVICSNRINQNEFDIAFCYFGSNYRFV